MIFQFLVRWAGKKTFRAVLDDSFIGITPKPINRLAFRDCADLYSLEISGTVPDPCIGMKGNPYRARARRGFPNDLVLTTDREDHYR